MKRAISIVVMIILAAAISFAADLAIGAVVSYEPSNCNLFDFSEFSMDDFNYGVSLRLFNSRKCTLTEEVTFQNLEKGNLDIESLTYLSRRWSLPAGFSLEAGLGIEVSFQNAVEGSDRLYVTMNGVSPKHLLELRRFQFLDCLGMVRPRLSVAKTIGSVGMVKLDYVLNLYNCSSLFSEGLAYRIPGMGKVSLALLYLL